MALLWHTGSEKRVDMLYTSPSRHDLCDSSSKTCRSISATNEKPPSYHRITETSMDIYLILTVSIDVRLPAAFLWLAVPM